MLSILRALGVVPIILTVVMPVHAAGPLAITTPAMLPPASVGTGYSQVLTATGGAPPYTWRFPLGALVPMSFELTSAGVLKGTPQPPDAGRTYSLDVQVSDSAGAQAVKTLSILVQQGAPNTPTALAVTSLSPLPEGAIGAAYTYTFAAGGGSKPYGNWTVLDAPPPGLILDPGTGVLHGTPSTADSYHFTVQVADAAGTTAQKRFDLKINGASQALTITTTTLPAASVGQQYSQTINASGGTPPYSWRFPLGESIGFANLNIDAGTGVLSCTPPASLAGQTLEFHVEVTDAAGQTAVKEFQLLIIQASGDPLRITTDANLPGATSGLFYRLALAATGGAAPYRWSVVDEADLPPGLTVDNTGVLCGVPAGNGNFSFTVQVTDAGGGTDQKTLQLTVKSPGDVIPAGPVPPLAAPTAVGVDSAHGRVYFVDRPNYDVYRPTGGTLPSNAVNVLDIKSGKLLSPVFVGDGSGDYQGIAVDAARSRVYVPNANENSVSVIDTNENRVVDTLSVGSGPTGAAVEPATGTVYITNSQDGTVSVLDPSGKLLGTVAVGANPVGVAVDSSTRRAYVITNLPCSIVVLEGTSKRAQLTLPDALDLYGIAIDPGSRVYAADNYGLIHVALLDGNTITDGGSFESGVSVAGLAVDRTSHAIYATGFGSLNVKAFGPDGSLIRSYDVQQGPTGIAFDQESGKAYVADTLADGYSVIDRAGAVENSAPVGTVNTGLAFDSAAHRVYAANLTGNSVSVIDPSAKQAVNSWPCGIYPWAIAADPALQQVYTVDVTDNALAVLSTVTGAILQKIALPDPATDAPFIAVNSRTHYVYVTQASGLSQFLTIIDGSQNRIVNTIQTGNRPVGIAVDENAGRVYVANANSGTITVLDAAQDQIIAQWNVDAPQIWSLAVDPNLQQLYVTVPPNTPADFHGLLVLDANTGATLQQLTLGSDSEMVLVNPNTGHVFVSDPTDNTVTVVDGRSFSVLNVYPAGNMSFAMTLDPDGTVYVANGVDGTLNVIRDAATVAP